MKGVELLGALLLALTSLPLWGQVEDAATASGLPRHLVLLHTDNLEGRLLSWSDKDDTEVGGMARTVQLLRGAGADVLVPKLDLLDIISLKSELERE